MTTPYRFSYGYNTSDPDLVDYRIRAWQDMQEKRDLVSDLYAGTEQMRARRERWLPRHEFEKPEAYKNRLRYSFLYGAYRDTVEKLASKPFSKLITVEGLKRDLKWLPAFLRDVDRTGRSITQFAHDMMLTGIHYGECPAITDSPREEGRTMTYEDVVTGKMRPLWRLWDPYNSIGWRYTTDENTGLVKFDHWRQYSCDTVPYGPYGDQRRHNVELWTDQGIEVWSKNDDQLSWMRRSSFKHTFGRVPVRVFYTNQTGVMTADPAMMDLAYMNQAHWISLSDHNNILRFARCGILFIKGITEDEFEKGIKTGPSALVTSTRVDADMKFVEYQGGAIPAGQEDLKYITDRMIILGLQPEMEQSKYSTAAGRSYDEMRAHSKLMQWINTLSEVLTDMLADSIRMMEPSVSDDELADLEVKIHYDPALTGQTSEVVRNLVLLRQAKEIPRPVFAEILKRLGVLPDDINLELFVKQVEQEVAEEEQKQKELLLQQAALKASAQEKSAGPKPAKPE